VHDPYDCDVVVVPFGPRFTHFNTTWRRFMERADKLLPLLTWKPHIIVAYQPAFMWVLPARPPACPWCLCVGGQGSLGPQRGRQGSLGPLPAGMPR
jgi:hypothetical protein